MESSDLKDAKAVRESQAASVRTRLCIVVLDAPAGHERRQVWTSSAEEFLRRIYKLGIDLMIIGPRPTHKIGGRRTVRFMDRHEVIGMKELEASRSHNLEFRVLGTKTRSWTRLRAEACVTWGPHGVWPSFHDGWTQPGTLALDAFLRWIHGYKSLPGRGIAFLGSTNQVLRAAIRALQAGAANCYVIEPGDRPLCWRAHRDRFISLGGRLLMDHSVVRAEGEGVPGLRKLYLRNPRGTLILDVDTLIVAPINEDALNRPSQWRKGLFFVKRRAHSVEPFRDEERWLESHDWNELYWRVGRFLGAIDQKNAEGAIKTLRLERKAALAYRESAAQGRSLRELRYSGKILDRETLAVVQASVSVPKSFSRPKPVASLECLEDVPCRACADACPESAIEIARLIEQPRLFEDKCTGCGACVAVCPAGAAVMVREISAQGKARYYLPDSGIGTYRSGLGVQLLNRRGEALGAGRVLSAQTYEDLPHRVVQVEASDVHVWEGRGFRVPPSTGAEDPHYLAPVEEIASRGWVLLNGVRRMCRLGEPASIVLWKAGYRRFEDALFCSDGSCRLCEIEVDGRRVLACQTLTKEGQDIRFARATAAAQSARESNPLCYCRQIEAREIMEMTLEGIPQKMVYERTGLGSGACHGRWCEESFEFASREEKLRPVFPGFERSPWRDVWAEDIFSEDPEAPARQDPLKPPRP
ncbi:MAG: 4Fe-4S dicluster domain-containing protein [Deltaproteobacteria bacterium]|nr:4Fe-4S dicluster domain-containing protein [Deltaproteobacteria bacterium]